jgi:MoaA/NifB/PqqE/SkfB family radical SAM enzyme
MIKSRSLVRNLYSIIKAHNIFPNHMDFFYSFARYHWLKARGATTVRGIELAITYKCNYNCCYCSAADFNKNNELSFDEIKKLIDDASKMGLCLISITGGEPILRKDLNEIIAYAKTKKVSCTMFTNASLLTEAKARELKKAGLMRLLVTYYGGNSQTFDEFTNHLGDFNLVRENVERAKKIGLNIGIQIVPTEEELTNGGLEEKIAFSRKNGLTVNFNFPARCGAWKKNMSIPLTRDKFTKVYELFKESWVTNDTLNSLSGERECPAVKRVVYITAQGDVMPCAYVPISWGNIREKSILEIMQQMQQSPVYKKDYDHCIAGENPDWVNRYIDPVYDNPNFKHLPLSVAQHPMKDELKGI